jgi:hypothetical protein
MDDYLFNYITKFDGKKRKEKKSASSKVSYLG